jgi:hypothetical protein
MSPIIKGDARRHQLVTTYGVGSIIALGDESFMVAGTDYWPVGDEPNVHEPRLERELRVQGFYDPPASGDDRRPDIPVVRFPEMHSCPKCKRLALHDSFTTYDGSKCGVCETLLVPSRFVVACQNGHIDDFPYGAWVHAGTKLSGDRHELSLESTGTTASLRDVVVSCSCGLPPVNLDGAFRSTALRGVSRCTGRSPWLRSRSPNCPETPRTLQRGASNAWYPLMRSALSIPPWSEGAFQKINRHWWVLRAVPEEALVHTIKGLFGENTGGYSVDDLVAAVNLRKSDLGADMPAVGEHSLRSAEYEALCRGRKETATSQEFVCEPVDIRGTTLTRSFGRVMSVSRLREVRALQSFTRVLPPGPADAPERIAALSDSDPGWLPAIEVKGEGVFLGIDQARLARWESDPAVVARARPIRDRYRKRFEALKKEPDREITPRFVLLHTLAHLLILQWSLECGYPTAALRERIYSAETMAGILIYTATTDSAGSLGGVVGLSDARRLQTALSEMLDRATWCSSDPLCSESTGAGVDSLNLAACHACALLPEVSCEEMNVLLDRATVVPTPGEATVGFFDGKYD